MKKTLLKAISTLFILSVLMTLSCFATTFSNRKIYVSDNNDVTSFYDNDFMNVAFATRRGGGVVDCYVFGNDDGTFSILDATNDPITVKKYSLNSFNQKSTKQISYELDIFSGFFAGEKYNYIAFGQSNKEEDDNKVVIKIVKYDKNFNKISSITT